MPKSLTLKRSLSFPLVCLYGLGNILGAGVYVLIGKVAGEAGYFTPFSFLMASVIAGITAFSFAELTSRYPLAREKQSKYRKALGLSSYHFLWVCS